MRTRGSCAKILIILGVALPTALSADAGLTAPAVHHEQKTETASLRHLLEISVLHQADEGEAVASRSRGPRRPSRRGRSLERVIAACERYSSFRSVTEHCIRHASRIAGRRPAEAVRACGEESSMSSGFRGCIEAAAGFRVAPAASIRACGDATRMNSQLVRCLEAASRHRDDPAAIIAYCDRRHHTAGRMISCVEDFFENRRRRR